MTEDDRIKLEPSWKHALRDQFELPYMAQLREFLRQEHAAGKEIYPPGPLIFNALNSATRHKVFAGFTTRLSTSSNAHR